MNSVIQFKTIVPLIRNSVSCSKTEEDVTTYRIAGRKLAIACMAAALVMVVWVPPLYAPQREKPEKLSIDVVTWNSTAQGFLVELSALFGIGTAGDNAEFTLRTVVEIADGAGNPIDVVEQSAVVVTREGSVPDADGFVQLAPQLIAWDRLGGTFVGPAIVTVSSELHNPAGRGVSLASDSPITMTIQ
jgi:hypothetical protein